MYTNIRRNLLVFLGVSLIILGGFLTFYLRAPEVRSYEIGIRRLRTYIFRAGTIDVNTAWERIDEENLIVETYIKFDVNNIFGDRLYDIIAVTYAGGPADKTLDLIRPGDDNYEEFLFPETTDKIVSKWEIDRYYSPPALTGIIIVASGIIFLVYGYLANDELINTSSVLDFTEEPERNVIGELLENKELLDKGNISRVEYNRRRNELI